ncbi:MAG TPA: hypothetical protein VGK54_01650, partial [Chloroflexota bacterium]
MRRSSVPIVALTLAAALAPAAPIAHGQSIPPAYSLKTTIPIPPWESLSTINVDIVWADPGSHMLSIADRGGAAIQVFDTDSDTFIGSFAAGQFAGRLSSSTGGANGTTFVSSNEVIGSDGDSTLKLVNIDTGEVQTISTGGSKRADEMAYDAATDRMVVANPNDDPPFITVLKIHPLQILGKLEYPGAAGIEQPLLAGDGKFWQALPATPNNPGGQIDLINTETASVERTIPTPDC